MTDTQTETKEIVLSESWQREALAARRRMSVIRYALQRLLRQAAIDGGLKPRECSIASTWLFEMHLAQSSYEYWALWEYAQSLQEMAGKHVEHRRFIGACVDEEMEAEMDQMSSKDLLDELSKKIKEAYSV